MASLARYPAFISRLHEADPELELLQGLIEVTTSQNVVDATIIAG